MEALFIESKGTLYPHRNTHRGVAEQNEPVSLGAPLNIHHFPHEYTQTKKPQREDTINIPTGLRWLCVSSCKKEREQQRLQGNHTQTPSQGLPSPYRRGPVLTELHRGVQGVFFRHWVRGFWGKQSPGDTLWVSHVSSLLSYSCSYLTLKYSGLWCWSWNSENHAAAQLAGPFGLCCQSRGQISHSAAARWFPRAFLSGSAQECSPSEQQHFLVAAESTFGFSNTWRNSFFRPPSAWRKEDQVSCAFSLQSWDSSLQGPFSKYWGFNNSNLFAP